MNNEHPKSLARRVMDRAKEAINDPDAFNKHMGENFRTPNQDIVKDYLKGRLKPTDPTYI